MNFLGIDDIINVCRALILNTWLYSIFLYSYGGNLQWRAGAHSARGAKCRDGAPSLAIAQNMLKIFPL